jgi:hypothetical protein
MLSATEYEQFILCIMTSQLKTKDLVNYVLPFLLVMLFVLFIFVTSVTHPNKTLFNFITVALSVTVCL